MTTSRSACSRYPASGRTLQHVMLTSLGRYSRLVLDSWTRPTYVKLAGARGTLKDATIERRFKRYGEWAGLAFWLYLTRTWVDEGLPV
jgi:3-methyladenine DNA glycosylase/8-oxoguanine DNA glycosylase